VFDQRIRIHALGGQWVALPELPSNAAPKPFAESHLKVVP
jgi:hypothetical protein